MPAHQEALEGFSERLRCVIEWEEGRGKKQAFARKIGVKPQQLSRYLHGRIPDAPTLLAVAEAGQVSVDWLLTGREARGGEMRAVSPASRLVLQRFVELPLPVLVVLLRVIDELGALRILEVLL
jgi:transcriptional regulator with XRE-family HTH domain